MLRREGRCAVFLLCFTALASASVLELPPALDANPVDVPHDVLSTLVHAKQEGKDASPAALMRLVETLKAQLAKEREDSRALRAHVERAEHASRAHGKHEKKDIDKDEAGSRDNYRELKRQLNELRQAFDEVLAEKRQLGVVVRDEHSQLTALQDQIRSPSLAVWLKERAIKLRELVDAPESDAVAYYARLYVKPRLGRVRHGLARLERRVERSVDHVLPARYGAFVAALLTAAIVGFPLAVAARLTVSLSRTLSLPQYVLLANVFLAALALALVFARVILQQDPLQTLYDASEQLFVLTQLALGVAFPAFLVLLGATAWRARGRGNAYIFACEFVFYVMIGFNYRRRVWLPSMVGEVIHANGTMYIVYLVDFICMTVLTVSAARGGDEIRATPFRRNGSYLPLSHVVNGKEDEAGKRDS